MADYIDKLTEKYRAAGVSPDAVVQLMVRAHIEGREAMLTDMLFKFNEVQLAEKSEKQPKCECSKLGSIRRGKHTPACAAIERSCIGCGSSFKTEDLLPWTGRTGKTLLYCRTCALKTPEAFCYCPRGDHGVHSSDCLLFGESALKPCGCGPSDGCNQCQPVNELKDQRDCLCTNFQLETKRHAKQCQVHKDAIAAAAFKLDSCTCDAFRIRAEHEEGCPLSKLAVGSSNVLSLSHCTCDPPGAIIHDKDCPLNVNALVRGTS